MTGMVGEVNSLASVWFTIDPAHSGSAEDFCDPGQDWYRDLLHSNNQDNEGMANDVRYSIVLKIKAITRHEWSVHKLSSKTTRFKPANRSAGAEAPEIGTGCRLSIRRSTNWMAFGQIKFPADESVFEIRF